MRTVHVALVASFGLLLATGARGGQADLLTGAERAQAITLGPSCQAPIVRIPADQHDFDVYVESPFARVALVTAAAQMMHQPGF